MKYATQFIHSQLKDILPKLTKHNEEAMLQQLTGLVLQARARIKEPEALDDAISACIGQYAILMMQMARNTPEVMNKPDDSLAGALGQIAKTLGASEENYFRHIYGGLGIARWYQHGQKIYEVSKGLTQRLWNTRLTGVTTDVLRLPFPAIAIRVPTDMGLPFHEIVVVESPEYTVAPEDILVTKDSKGRAYEKLAERVRKAGKCPRSWRVSATRIEDAAGKEETRSTGAIRLWEGQDLEEALDDCLYESWSDQTRQAMSLAINVVLYTSWPDTGEAFEERVSQEWAELKRRIAQLSGYKKERAREKLKDLWAEKRIYLGAKVPFMAASDETDGTGQKLTVRTLVSGHWKMQPCGPKLSERKLIRIEPFWRGPLDGPVSNPIRKVS